MNTDMKRRVFLRGSMAAGAVGVAVGAGLLAPQSVMAAWPKAAFDAKSVAEAGKTAMGGTDIVESSDIKIKAPDIAENGAVVPVTVTVKPSMEGVESIAILAASNGQPLVGLFKLGEGAVANVSTRIKMGKTGDVVALVKAGGKLYSNKKNVKVTIGGCGG
jgi:sulfur-oxidizing protein SoxY